MDALGQIKVRHQSNPAYLHLKGLQDFIEQSSGRQSLSHQRHFIVFECLVVEQIIADFNCQSTGFLNEKHLMRVRMCVRM